MPNTPKLPTGNEQGDWFSKDYWDGSSNYVDATTRLKRKQEGRCEECGELRPMLTAAWGLDECPQHPKEKPETKW